MGDPLAATNALTRAAELAPDARFVASAWRWLAEQGADLLAVRERARAELAHVGEGRERVALLWQAAAIEEHAAGDVGAATRTIRELTALEPNDLGALDTIAALHLRARGGDRAGWTDAEPFAGDDDVVFGGVATALEQMAHVTGDAVTRSALHGAAGALRDRYLADVDGAQASLRRALEADPTNPGAQATLEAILLRRRAWDEYARIVAAQADRTAEAIVAREHYERAGDVYAECVGDHARAAHCYVRAATLAESDPGPVEKLAHVLEGAARWDDAAAAYERLLARLRAPEQRAWTLVRLGRLQETRLGRADDALATYRLAAEASPTFGPATDALLRLCRERKLPLAVDLERREADRIVDPAVRAVRYAALAEYVEAESPADLSEEAATLYERTLALDPTNAAAFDALDRMFRASSQWPRLVALYENALSRSAHPRRARSLRLQLAEILHARLGQPGRAADLRREALDGPEDRYDVLVSLARALADAGRWSEYIEALEAQAAMLDGADEIAAVYRIGATLETRVKDRRRALATYEIVIDRAPRHEGAARAIARIHEQEGRWEQVIDAERRLLDLATRPDDVVDGLVRIARVFEEELGRVDEAVTAYLEALHRAPTSAPVVAALERLLRAAGDHRRLAQVLQRYADAAADPELAARVRLRAASILELCLDDSDTACATYTRVAEAHASGASPTPFAEADRQAALWGLVRLHETRGEWERVDAVLAEILEATSEPSAQKRVLVRRARNAELRLDDAPRAARLYDEALTTGERPAAMAVDRLRVARLEGKRDAIAGCLSAMAASTTDARLETGLLRVLALAVEHGGAAPAVFVGAGGSGPTVTGASSTYAASIYERLVARDPEDAQALDGLARCLAASPGGASSDGRLPSTLIARARAAEDTSLRALLAFAAGVLDESAGRGDVAEAAYAFALAADPELTPALDASRRLRAAAGDWNAVASLAERSANASLDRENVAEAWLAAAEIHEREIGDPARALASYRALLAAQPEHAHALERSLVLFEASSDFGGAASVLLAHAEALGHDPAAQARALTRRATILASRIGDTAGAIVDLRRAMALAREGAAGEDDVKTVQALAILEERVRNWQEALQLYEQIAEMKSRAADRSGPSSTTRRRARLAQARIYGDELRDDVKAKEILEALVAERPDDRDASFRLADVSARSGHEARALELYETLSASGSAPERVRALVALSDVQRGRPDDASKAEGEAALARAFDLAIADPTMIAPLEDRVARDGDFRSFVAHAEAAVSRVRPNTPGVLPLRTAIARVLRDELGSPEAADRQLAATIQAFPDSMETRLTLAAALVGRNDDAAIAELRRAVNADPTAPGPFEALVTVAAKTGRAEIAVMLASAAALLGATSPEVEATLASAKPARPLPEAFLYDEAMSRLVGPSRARFLRGVLATLEPFLGKIFPGGEAMLETRARLPETYPVAGDIRAIASTLGVYAPSVHRGVGREIALLLTEPRALVLGSDLLTDAGRPLAAFHGAYACARMAASGSIYVAPRQQAAAMLDAATLPDADGPAIRDYRKRIGSALPRKTKKELERIVSESGADLHAELAVWEAEESRRALYSAVVLCRDLRAVAQVIASDALALPRVEDRRQALAQSGRLREILEFVASSACWDIVQRVYGHP
ncbi:MAG: tetratricopeptide repeat protein [Labilithrix sp.]|nr:tetratricopeptide repeat protein [Labilithrix sp.]